MSIKVRIGHTFEFCGAHYLPGHKGKCANLHGHTWKVEVVIEESEINKTHQRICHTLYKEHTHELKDAMIIDFSLFKEKVRNVLQSLDHKELNEVIPFPTAEAIACLIFKILSSLFLAMSKSYIVVKVKVWESSDSYAEVINE